MEIFFIAPPLPSAKIITFKGEYGQLVVLRLSFVGVQ